MPTNLPLIYADDADLRLDQLVRPLPFSVDDEGARAMRVTYLLGQLLLLSIVFGQQNQEMQTPIGCTSRNNYREFRRKVTGREFNFDSGKSRPDAALSSDE